MQNKSIRGATYAMLVGVVSKLIRQELASLILAEDKEEEEEEYIYSAQADYIFMLCDGNDGSPEMGVSLLLLLFFLFLLNNNM